MKAIVPVLQCIAEQTHGPAAAMSASISDRLLSIRNKVSRAASTSVHAKKNNKPSRLRILAISDLNPTILQELGYEVVKNKGSGAVSSDMLMLQCSDDQKRTVNQLKMSRRAITAQNQNKKQAYPFCMQLPAHMATGFSVQNRGKRQLKEEDNCMFFVIPPDAKTNDLVWLCGGWQEKWHMQQALTAVIHKATQDKQNGEEFSLVAKSASRLNELGYGLKTGSSSRLKSGQVIIAPSRLNHLFPLMPAEIRQQLKLDAEASYSVTDERTANKISKIILNLPAISASSVVVDGTACVGGNLLSFLRVFKNVVGIEMDPVRFGMLRSNVEAVQRQERQAGAKSLGKARLEQGDCCSLLLRRESSKSSSGSPKRGLRGLNSRNFRFRYDVLFLDPPWGGLAYKDAEEVELFLSGLGMGEVVRAAAANTDARYVVLKVPFNCALAGVAREMQPGGAIVRMQETALGKTMKLIVVHLKERLRNKSPTAPKDQEEEEEEEEEEEGELCRQENANAIAEFDATRAKKKRRRALV